MPRTVGGSRYLERVDALLRALSWEEASESGDCESVATLSGMLLDWSPVDIVVAALDAEVLGYAELIPPAEFFENRPESYSVSLTDAGARRLAELRATALS
jgi:hypothetical protein